MDNVDVLADRCQGPQDLCNPDGEGEWAGVKTVLADPTDVVFAVEGAFECPGGYCWG